MAGQNVDHKRLLSEIEVSFDTYFDKYVTPHIRDAKKEWDDAKRQEILYSNYSGVHAEDLWNGVGFRLENDHKFQLDFRFMTDAYRDALVSKIGKDEYARLSHQCSTGDLASQYMFERLHSRTWEQFGKLNVDKSKVNFFVSHVFDKLIGKMSGLDSAGDVQLAKETRFYTDTGLRKAADSTAVTLDLVTSPGKIWKLLTLGSTIQDLKEEYANKDNSLPVDRLIGPAVAGSAAGMQRLRSNAKTYDYPDNSHMKNLNECLTRSVYGFFDIKSVQQQQKDMERAVGGDLGKMSQYGLEVIERIDNAKGIKSSYKDRQKNNDGFVPEWVLKESDDSLRQHAAEYAKFAADLKDKGEAGLRVGPKNEYLDKTEVMKRCEWYDMALAMRGVTCDAKDYAKNMRHVGLMPYGSRPAEWIQKKNDADLLKSTAYYSSLFTEMEMKGKKVVRIGKQELSYADVKQRVYDLSHECSLRTLDRQRKAEEAERLAAAKEKEAQRAAKKAEYGTASADDTVAQYERAGAANIERRAQTEQRVQSMSDASKTWENVVDHSGLNGLSGLGDNLGYTLAMLPDMIMGMLTGQNKNLTLHKGALPLLMVFGSLFCHNPIMKYLLLGLGGLGFLGQSNKELQGREGTSRTLSTYKRYPDEPTDGRIVFNGIKGQDIAVTIDGNPFVVQLDPLTIDSYNRGAVSQGALCNAVLKAYDEQYSGVSERYERVVNQQEQDKLDQTLALK